MYDVDGADVPRSTVRELHERGRRVVCYVDVGTWEDWRDDADRFPKAARGKPVDGWPGEYWLDVRRHDIRPILAARLKRCRDRGYDGIDPENVNGYTNDTGFPLTAADQREFNRWVAARAHGLGLAVGLKNELEQAKELEPRFDFAVLESCFEFDECGPARRFVSANKAVVAVEYELPRSSFCPRARELRFAAMLKRLALGAWRRPCG